MDQKAKFIIIGLGGVALISLFLFIQSLVSKQPILRQREELKKENISLSSKIGKLESGIREYENKISSLNADLEKASQEKTELDKRYELLNKTKEELIEKLNKPQPPQQPPPQAQVQGPPVLQATDAYWAGILQAKTDLEMQLGSLRKEFRTIQINNEQLQKEKSSLELEINNLRRENEDTGRQIDYNKKVMDSIAQELVREKNDKAQIQNSLKIIRNENMVLIRQLKSLNNRKISLEKRLKDVQETKESIERKYDEMETMLTDRISYINEIKEQLDGIRVGKTEAVEAPKKRSVDLPPIVVRPQSAYTAQAAPGAAVLSLTGKILAINKESNFVIIDLGEDSGLKAGDSLQVYRDGNSIAAVEVIQVRKNLSACDIVKETIPLQVNDIVR